MVLSSGPFPLLLLGTLLLQVAFGHDDNLGLRHGREMIVGGKVAQNGSFPFFASLTGMFVTNLNEEFKPFCGGTLISERWVLTAAHCLGSKPAHVGININKLVPLSPQAQIRGVTRIIAHPDYNTTSSYNDIGLVELDEPVENVPLVKLPNNMTFPPGMGLQVIGFGYTDPDIREMSNVLRKVNVPVVSRSTCRRGAFLGKYKQIWEKQICASRKGKDSCTGDSGGPLLTPDGVQVGIVSYGFDCGLGNTAPGVYTNVQSYRDWILETMKSK